jgi:hypothetical protein
MCASGWRRMDSHRIIRVHHRTLVGLSFAILYNLPPTLCMKYEYMFLCLIIPGPDHPGSRINVMLKPLIEELKQLWQRVEPFLDLIHSSLSNLHFYYFYQNKYGEEMVRRHGKGFNWREADIDLMAMYAS